MPLDRQVLTVPFSKGVDTKTDPNSVPAGRFLILENAVFTHPESFRKRNGYSALGTGGPTVGQACMAYQNELLIADKSTLYSYDAANTSWISKGGLVSANVTQSAIIRNTFQQTGQDSASHSAGLSAFAWEDTQGGSRYCVVDSTTGQVVQTSTLIVSTAIKPKFFAIGNYFVLLYVNTADANLYAATIPVSAPNTVLAPIALTTAGSTSSSLNSTAPNYDAAVMTTSAGSQLYVAFNTNQGGAGISIFSYSSITPLSRTASVNWTGDAATVINIFADTARQGPVCCYWNSTAVKTRAYDSSLMTLFAADQIEVVANVVSITGVSISSTTTNLKVFYSVSAASTYNYLTKIATITNNPGPSGQRIGQMLLPAIPWTSPVEDVSTAAAVFLRSVSLVGKAFAYNGLAYVPLAYQSPLQPTYFVADQSGNLVAKILYSLAGNIPTRASNGSAMLAEVNASGTTYQIALLAKDLLTTNSGQVYTQTGVESVSLNFFDTANSYQRAQLGQNLHISGGFLQMYDGIGAVEHGFHLFPEPITVTAVGAGGSLGAGSYQVIVVYEWIDNQGQTHRSGTSIAKTVTAVNNDSLTVTIPTLRLTAKQARSSVNLAVYRTIATGSTFFLDSSITSPTANSTTADSVTFTCTQSDTSLQGNPLLYTTGGVIENISPNACSALVVHRNRLWALDPTNPLQWWYSKQVLPPSIGVNTPPAEFSDLFIYSVDPRGGNVTAGASLDDKFIHFKASLIMATLGQGPDPTGGQNDFSDAQLVTTDVGCVNPRSIVLVPDGLMFQSQKGIYLLNRALQVSYIGADVEFYNSQSVTSAQLIPSTNQVRFTMSSGVALVYDYFVGQWGVFTNLSAVDSTIWLNQFVYLQAGGTVGLETVGAFSDFGNYIKLRAQTSWLQFAGVQGFQRARRAYLLGSFLSAHELLVQVAYDFNPAAVQQDYITPTVPTTYGADATYGSGSIYGGAFPLWQWRVDLAKQKCEAIQLTIEDLSTGTVGEGLELSSLLFEVAVKRGGFKLPAASQFG